MTGRIHHGHTTIEHRWAAAHAAGYTTIPTAAEHIGCTPKTLETSIRRGLKAGHNIPKPAGHRGSDDALRGVERLGTTAPNTPAEKHTVRTRIHALAHDATETATVIAALGIGEETA